MNPFEFASQLLLRVFVWVTERLVPTAAQRHARAAEELLPALEEARDLFEGASGLNGVIFFAHVDDVRGVTQFLDDRAGTGPRRLRRRTSRVVRELRAFYRGTMPDDVQPPGEAYARKKFTRSQAAARGYRAATAAIQACHAYAHGGDQPPS